MFVVFGARNLLTDIISGIYYHTAKVKKIIIIIRYDPFNYYVSIDTASTTWDKKLYDQ